MSLSLLPPVYAILDTAALNRLSLSLRDCATAMLEGGIRLMQIRHKGHWTNLLYDEARRVSECCINHQATLIINDRADIAALLGSGVHVGQEDLSPTDVRQVVGHGSIVGLSTHNEVQFRSALHQPVSYVALGPIFSTNSKLNPDPVVGVAELRSLRRITDLPIVAIGGINRGNVLSVWHSGADSVAVIGDLYPPAAGVTAIRKRAEEWVKISSNAKRNRSRD